MKRTGDVGGCGRRMALHCPLLAIVWADSMNECVNEWQVKMADKKISRLDDKEMRRKKNRSKEVGKAGRTEEVRKWQLCTGQLETTLWA